MRLTSLTTGTAKHRGKKKEDEEPDWKEVEKEDQFRRQQELMVGP